MRTDPYLWSDADCLRNDLGIKDPEVLAQFEDRIVSSRDVELARQTLPGEYNLQHFQRFHWSLFRDIYDWAGQARTVDITKDGLPFGSHLFLEEEVSAVLEGLATDRWLIGLRRTPFLNKLAYYYGELNARHMFREGNGRTQRAFLRQLSAAAGWRLDWSAMKAEDNVSASRHNLLTAEHDQLVAVFGPVLTHM